MKFDKIRIICPTGECKNCIWHIGKFDVNCYKDKNLVSNTWLFATVQADGSICFVRIDCPQFKVIVNPDGSCSPMVEFAGASKEWTGLVDFINKIAPSEIFKDTSSVCFKKDPETWCITAFSDEVECIIPTDDTGNITIKITPKTDPNSQEIQVPKLIEITRVRCATWPLIDDQYGYERQQGEDTEDLYFELKKSAKEPWHLALFDAKGREQGKPLDLMQCMKDNLITQIPPAWWIDCDNAVLWLVQGLACHAVSPRQLIESCDVLTTLVNVSFGTDDDGNLEVCVKYKDENGTVQEECWPLNMSAQTICQYIVDECGATLEVDPDTWIIEFIGNDQVPVLINICDIVTQHCISVDAGNILNIWSDGKLYVGNPIVKDWIAFAIDPITCIATITCTFSDGSVDTVVAQVPDCDNTVQDIQVVNNNDGTATISWIYENGTIDTALISLLLKDCNGANIDLWSYLFQECRVVVASYTENYNATTGDVTTVITYTDGSTATFIHPTDTDNTVTNINVVDNWNGTANLTYNLEDGTLVTIPFSLTIMDCLWNLVELWTPQFVTGASLPIPPQDTCAVNPTDSPNLVRGKIWKEADGEINIWYIPSRHRDEVISDPSQLPTTALIGDTVTMNCEDICVTFRAKMCDPTPDSAGWEIIWVPNNQYCVSAIPNISTQHDFSAEAPTANDWALARWDIRHIHDVPAPCFDPRERWYRRVAEFNMQSYWIASWTRPTPDICTQVLVSQFASSSGWGAYCRARNERENVFVDSSCSTSATNFSRWMVNPAIDEIRYLNPINPWTITALTRVEISAFLLAQGIVPENITVETNIDLVYRLSK